MYGCGMLTIMPFLIPLLDIVAQWHVVILLQMVPSRFLDCCTFAYLLSCGLITYLDVPMNALFHLKVNLYVLGRMMQLWGYGTQEVHKADMLFEVNCHLCCNDRICLDVLSQQHTWNLFNFCVSLIVGHGYHTDGLTCLSITLDSQTVVSGSKDNSVHIVNVNSGQVGDNVCTLTKHSILASLCLFTVLPFSVNAWSFCRSSVH